MVDHRPTSDDGFKNALKTLLGRAIENGVNVEGGWKISTDTGRHWDVQITAVEYGEGEED